MPLRQLVQAGSEHLLTNTRGVVHHPLVLHGGDGRHRGRAGQGVSGVGEPAGVGAVGEGVVDRVTDRHAPEGHVARGDALGEGQQIRHNIEIVDTEPLPGAAEAGHHLVGDEDDAVAVADLPHARHIAGRGHHDAGGAGNRFQDDRGDRCRALVGDESLEVVQCALGLLVLIVGVKR